MKKSLKPIFVFLLQNTKLIIFSITNKNRDRENVLTVPFIVLDVIFLKQSFIFVNIANGFGLVVLIHMFSNKVFLNYFALIKSTIAI